MRAVRATLRDNAGMTVVEVIIALGVITVGLLALIAAMPLSTSLIGESNLKTTGTFLAQQRFEQIKNAKWTIAPGADCLGVSPSVDAAPVTATWVNCPGAAPAGLVTYPDEGFTTMTAYPRFQRQVRIENCSAASCGVASNALRRVTVTVSFASMTGPGTLNDATLESMRLVTLIAQRP